MAVTYVSFVLCPSLAVKCKRDGHTLRYISKGSFAVPAMEDVRTQECHHSIPLKFSGFRNAARYFCKGENCY